MSSVFGTYFSQAIKKILMIAAPLSVVKAEASHFHNHSNLYISIYVPLQSGGSGSYQSRNRLRFCMSIRKIEKKLLDKGYSFVKIREHLKPLELLVDSGIWRRNCAGNVLFYKNKTVKVFSFDRNISQIEFVGENFYIEPLRKYPSREQDHIIDVLKQMDNTEREYILAAW